ncbi:helicase [Aquabacterium olei]|uniref:Helicase n=1 Tax=Aquabacterium olei TaxID=1296669 RepID=A0A2U8FPM3_9BURK|nr:cysteine-rich CWC family protein [Aquabacterium olei]AWI52963.1 helicase [Aquabacterium olei]
MKPPTADAMNDAVCPLCGGPNGCALSGARSLDAPCWCKSVAFSPALLARVPRDKRGLACICQRCATAGGLPAATPADR